MTEQIEKMDFERLVVNELSPGEMLKQAREAKNLSHSEVAKQLKLRVQWIVDIENDNYKDAVALIYVRGYLSAYARLVQLDPEEVFSSFCAMKFDEPFQARKQVSLSEDHFANHQPILSYSKSKQNAAGKLLRYSTLLVILTLVVLVALWWRGQKLNINLHSNSPGVTLPAQLQAQATEAELPVSEKSAVVAPVMAKQAKWKRVADK